MIKLSNSVYDKMKWVVQVVIPATASLYFALAEIWGFPGAENVVGTLAVLTTFLGVLLGLSSAEYRNSDRAYDGAIVVESNDEGNKIFSLELDNTPEEIEEMDNLSFKVMNQSDKQ